MTFLLSPAAKVTRLNAFKSLTERVTELTLSRT